jgi:hypothetical protein
VPVASLLAGCMASVYEYCLNCSMNHTVLMQDMLQSCFC